ncbi:hypothetical protein NDU88_000179, partial [Pleurodeles waltl]
AHSAIKAMTRAAWMGRALAKVLNPGPRPDEAADSSLGALTGAPGPARASGHKKLKAGFLTLLHGSVSSSCLFI